MKRIKLTVIILIIAVVIISTGIWWFVNSASSESSAGILTSGFIEARDVAIASETEGRIVNITAEEGDNVEASMPLVKLDDTILKAQLREAESAVAVARARLTQAIISRDGAQRIWENALDVRANPLELEAKIIAAQGELELTELVLERAGYQDPTWGNWEERTAELRHDIAQKTLQNLLAIWDNPQEINAAVDNAYATYQTAVAAAEVTAEQVGQAEASLETIKARLDKLTLSSPISGVVATQYAEVGEIAQPGAPILTITQLEEVTLTAYVPESKIGLVKLGQEALVSVDSYPEESFVGKVVYISPQAQFTPRNVQLKEEREKTVFAVKIRLANPDQKLKPGMPADARIITDSEG